MRRGRLFVFDDRMNSGALGRVYEPGRRQKLSVAVCVSNVVSSLHVVSNMKLGLREANQQFSRAIKAVRAGREVVLTERGRPIAVIKPVKTEDAQDARLQAMADEGLIIPAAQKGPMPAPRWRPVKMNGKPLSQTIIHERQDRA